MERPAGAFVLLRAPAELGASAPAEHTKARAFCLGLPASLGQNARALVLCRRGANYFSAVGGYILSCSSTNSPSPTALPQSQGRN
jgi:hypothetical protein